MHRNSDKADAIFGEDYYLPRVEEDDLKRTFDAIDTNQDGYISIAETVYAFHYESLFNKIDQNKDGKISSIELNEWGLEWPEVLRFFEDHNQYNAGNSDNLIKFYEFENYFKEKSNIDGIDHKCSLRVEDDPQF